jgi:hypothetical protein
MAFHALAGLRQILASRLTIGIGGLLALGLTTAQNVADAISPPAVPVVAPGRPIAAGRWQVTLYEAGLTHDKRPDGYRGRAGTKALTVDLDLANRSSESSNAFSRILSVDPPIAGLSPMPTAYLLRDGAILGDLQPGLPERIRMVWELPDAAPVPETLRLVVIGETFKPRDNLLAAPGWFNPKPAATVTLALKQAEKDRDW